MKTTERIEIDEVLERAFDRKRDSLLEDYDLKSKPMVIWQALPAAELEVDISNEKLSEAMRQGGGPGTNNGWWDGFQIPGMPSLVFDGLASGSSSNRPGWVSEVHVDGHVAAGIWTFPEAVSDAGPSGLGVADFYVDAFRDFAYLASRVFEVFGVTEAIHVTVTMYKAEKLALLLGNGRIAKPAPKRQTLRWPIKTVNASDLPKACSAMAAQFMRAYGRRAPKL